MDKDASSQAQDYSETAVSERSKTLAPSDGIVTAHWWAYNVHMGADNIIANAVTVMGNRGVSEIAGGGQFRYGTGSSGQTVTFISALTGAGPLSFCVLTVSDTNSTQATSLRDAIRDELKPRLGIA